MSLVSAAFGKTRGSQRVSQLQYDAQQIAEQVTEMAEQGSVVGAKIDDLKSQQTMMALGDGGFNFDNGAFSNFVKNNKAKESKKGKAGLPSIDEIKKVVYMKIERLVTFLKKIRDALHLKEKRLTAKKNAVETLLKTAQADYEREKKFEDQAIKTGYSYA